MLMVPHSELWIFPENHFKGSTRPGGDRIESCSQPQVHINVLVPGTVLLWEALGSSVHPGLAACPRTRAFLTGSCAQPCLNTAPSSCLRASSRMLQFQPGMGARNWGGAFPSTGTNPCPALGQVLPLCRALVWPPPESYSHISLCKVH